MNQKGFASPLILVGIAISVLIGGAVVYQKVLAPGSQLTPVSVVSSSPILTPTITTTPSSVLQPSPGPDLTADWKTYTGKYFSIKYPTSWSFIEEKPWRTEDLFPALKLSPFLNNGQSITITVTNNLDLTLDQFIDIKRGLDPNTFNTITIGGVSGKIKRDYVTVFNSELVVVNRVGIGKTFDVLWTKSPGVVIEDKTFDQTISTFKFLD